MAPDLRPATIAERALVEWLLTHAAVVSEPAPFLRQVPALRVVDKPACGCGCPSVAFEHQEEAAGATIIGEAGGVSPEGVAVGVIVWARADRLAGLEVYDYEGIRPLTLPRLEDLRPIFEGGAA